MSSHDKKGTERIATIILGGGQGSRLFPLTQETPKPAIPFGGRYRLIDVPISSSINSGIKKIFVITQFLSSSLHRHLMQTYRFDSFSSGFIELLNPEQRPTGEAWFQGTADAVRQNIKHFIEAPVDYFLILSGDQLYNIDFTQMVAFAKEKDADLVIASLAITRKDAYRMGVLKIDEKNAIQEFYEKPQDDLLLDQLQLSEETLKAWKISHESKRTHLGSMGIYVFKRDVLLKLLLEDKREDFGKHLIPTQIDKGRVFSFIHQGYWEDIGTIESFFKANIALTQPTPEFNFYDADNTIYSALHNLPAPKMIGNCAIQNSIICEGSIIDNSQVQNSILGNRCIIKKGCFIQDTVIMGSDSYDPPPNTHDEYDSYLHVSENCVLKNCIIDRNVHIGRGVRLINAQQHKTLDGEFFYIRDGIIIIPRGASVPNGFTL
jgi:glucose-1-phosphate adenylyltransferase